MKTSLAWLNRYLQRPCDEAEVERLLTGVGFPVEGREDVTLSSGKTDVALDVEITSNRSDCLCHLGLARELAAASDRTLQPPDCEVTEGSGPAVAELTRVASEDEALCPLYTARVITGVKVGPSPAWLVDCLEAAGLRSVNNVVDVTNFVLLELGQPLHAFDLARLDDRRIVVRRARKGETIVAIDGTKHTLRDDMLVIADANKPVAVAGVMGGLDSEVSDTTTDILLESAMFAPLSVRTTSRALKLSSDSSYRFERGVDPNGVEAASRRAAQLILDVAGGTLAPGVIRAGIAPPAPRQVAMRMARCNALLGVELSAEEQMTALGNLQLAPKRDGDRLVCTIPTFRLDLHREVDLVEDVARLHGLNRIPMHDRLSVDVRPIQNEVAARRQLGRVLVGRGFHETITFSFVGPKQGEPFVPEGAEAVLIEDERRRAEPMLRPSLLPSLLACRKANQDAGNSDVKLYEMASAWWKRGETIEETRQLALLADAEDRQLAVRELRGTIEELIERLGAAAALKRLRFEPAEHPVFNPAATIHLGDEVIGAMGVVTEKVRDVFDVKVPVVGAILRVEPVVALYPPRRQVSELPRYPAIERDLSVIVDEAVPWRQIAEAVGAARPAMLEDLEFITTYRGKPIERGRKSVSFRMIFRDPGKTLRHEEVDPQVESVVAKLKQAVGAELRA